MLRKLTGSCWATTVIIASVFASILAAQEGVDLLHRDGFEDCNTFNPAPGALFWDGGGDGTTWSDPFNWVGDAVPVDDDAVAIGGETRFTVVYDVTAGDTRLAHLDSCQNLHITGGQLEVDGPGFARAILQLSGGTLIATGPFLVGHTFEQDSNGTLQGIGSMTVSNQFIWSDGEQEGTGETIINGTSTIDTTIKVLRERTLTLNGATTWSGGNLNLSPGATINVNAPFDIQTDADMLHAAGINSTFNNTSTLTKSSGAGLATITADFVNSGDVSLSSGALGFGRTYTQDARGSLNVNKSSSVDFDSYAITQGATLDGTLDITLLGGFMPGLGEMFEIMTFASRTGTFATVNGMSIGNGNEFDVVYGANDVTLNVIAE